MASKSKRAKMAPKENLQRKFLLWAFAVFLIKLAIDFFETSIIDEYQKRIKLKDSLLYFVKSNNKRHNIFGLWSIELLKPLEDDLIKSLDFKYSEITAEDGIAQVLKRNRLLKEYLNPMEVQSAVSEPPEDTRAWFRGKSVSKFSKSIAAASWDSLIFDIDKNQPLFRISTTDPLKGTKSLTGEMISQSDTALDLVDSIRKNPEVY